MVKTDEHMGRIRDKMVDEAAGKKAAAEARKQRDLRKFGKQVQVARAQERDKAKREERRAVELFIVRRWWGIRSSLSAEERDERSERGISSFSSSSSSSSLLSKGCSVSFLGVASVCLPLG